MNAREIDKLTKEALQLERILAEAGRFLEKAPEGTLQIKPHKQGVQYYHRMEPGDKDGIYISKKNMKLIRALAQKRYLERILPAAEEQLKSLKTCLRTYDPDALKKVFLTESAERQKLIRSIELPDKLYSEMWLAQEYERKAFAEDTPEHYTLKKERVRSKSEVMIANALFHAGIPYKYECPLMVRKKLIYPDFTILREYDRTILYWEHQGMMDDADYRNHAVQRVRDFEDEGIFPGDQLIITVETLKIPLNAAEVDRIIKHYLLP